MAMNMLELRAMLQRGDARVLGQEAAATPPAPATLALLGQMQALAKQHGWQGQHTTRGDTDAQELECLLVREVLLYALLQPDQTPLTPRQLAWVTALRATGAIEVYIWGHHDLPAITARLARKRGS
jgi:hypothetical protein